MAILPYWKEDVINEGTSYEQIQYTPNTNIPSIQDIRERWCFGLPLNKENGDVMPDEDIKAYIDRAISEVERRLGIYLKPTVIACNPWERGLVEGVDYEEEDYPYDYNVKHYRNYGFLQLRERPLLELTGFKMVLPNGNIIMDFMRDESTRRWIKLDKSGSQIQIVPYAGDPTLFYLMGGSQSGYPFVTGRLNSNLPQMFYVDYVAGYAQHKIPHEITGIIAKMASCDVLGIAGDAVLAGVASLSTSVDGLSESFSTTASATSATYGAHIKQYQDDIKAFFEKGAGRSAYRGITMTGL